MPRPNEFGPRNLARAMVFVGANSFAQYFSPLGSCGVPSRDKLAPVWLARRRNLFSRERQLSRVLLGRERAAHLLKAQIQQVRVEHVGLAIAADVVDPAGLVRGEDFGSVEAELAGKAAQARHRIETRAGARLKRREHVHQVEMAR